MRLILVCASALGGLAIGDLTRLDVPRLACAATLALLGAILAWRHTATQPLALAALLACAAALGGLRATLAHPAHDQPALAPFIGTTLDLRGQVAQPPTRGPASEQLQLDVSAAAPAGAKPSLMSTAREPSPVSPGGEPSAESAGPQPSLLSAGREPPAVSAAAEPPLVSPGHASPPVSAVGEPRQGSAEGEPLPVSAGPKPSQDIAGGEPSPVSARPHPSPLSAGREPPAVSAADGSQAVLGRVRVVGDPAVLGAVADGETLVLEGRLLADADASRPPVLLFPKLLERDPPPTASITDPAAMLGRLRAAAERNIRQHLPDPQASLAVGVLLGGNQGLDAAFRLDLQRSGLSHLVAIDGFKLTVVTAGLGALAVHSLGPRLATLPIGVGIAGYTLLTGAHASAVRAALMVGLAMLASLSGRVADPLTGVLLAALAMACVDPPILLDLGMQLSLSATLGIVLLWPRWRERLRRVPRLVAEPAGLTLAVTCATLPITLSVFTLVSLVSPLAHVLAVPLLAPVLLSAALLALVSRIPPLGVAAGWLAWLPTTLLVDVIRVCASLPGAAVATGRLPPLAAGALASAVLGWGVAGLAEAAPARAAWARCQAWCADWWMPLPAVAAGTIAVSLLVMVRPDHRLHVQPLAAGRGQAVLVRGPTGRTALLVGGRLDGALLASQVADHLALWEHRLDCVVQLDPTADAGLAPTLARYRPIQRLAAAANLRIDLGGGAVLDVYAPVSAYDARRAAAAVSDAAVSAPLAQGAAPVAESLSNAAAPQPATATDDSAARPKIAASPDVAVRYGSVWIPVLGRPPPPEDWSTPGPAPLQATGATETDLVSDGNEVWADGARAL